MSDHSDDSVIPDSTYPILEPPGDFKSQIPEHLLVDASTADRYLMEQMSIMRQYMTWSVGAHLSADKNLRRTNGRLMKAEGNIAGLKEDRRFLKSGWKTLVIVGGVISGFASFLALIYQTLGGGK